MFQCLEHNASLPKQKEAYVSGHGVGCVVTDLKCVGRGSYSIHYLVLSDLILSNSHY